MHLAHALHASSYLTWSIEYHQFMPLLMYTAALCRRCGCQLCISCCCKREHDVACVQFIAGPPDENQVLYNESTWTNIIEPAASNAAAYVLSTPAMANCNAGQQKCMTLHSYLQSGFTNVSGYIYVCKCQQF